MIIYKIQNKINGKVYIGQTKQPIEARWNQHCNNEDSISAIAAAINKYGKDNFILDIVSHAETQEQLDILEKNNIEKFNSMAPNGYNLKHGGLTGSVYSDISKEKMSKAKQGTSVTKNTRSKMSKSHKERFKDSKTVKQRSEVSKKVWESQEYRDKIKASRKKYWTKESNRERASIRAKEFVDEKFKEKVGAAVKQSLSKPETQDKLKKFYKSREKRVLCSNGIIYPSVKVAAEELGISSSAIVRVISGKYKSSGGYTFTYDSVHAIKPKSVVYLVCGVSGSGKSWICNQLVGLAHYVSFDGEAKDKHVELISTLSNDNKPILYDPTFKISTFIKNNSKSFDIRPVFIIEDVEVIAGRLYGRGGDFNDKTLSRMKSIDRRTQKYAIFSGTSDQVLEFLKSELT